MAIMLTKFLLEVILPQTKIQFSLGLPRTFVRENFGAIAAAEVNRRKVLARQSAECTLYRKEVLDFFMQWTSSDK